MIDVNIFLQIALYRTGIVYLIMLLLLTQLVFLKTDLINFGEIKHAILIIQLTVYIYIYIYIYIHILDIYNIQYIFYLNIVPIV